jgi:type II secretory pathway pseudopilin PulG
VSRLHNLTCLQRILRFKTLVARFVICTSKAFGASFFLKVLDFPTRCQRVSLSLWERAGVRGIGPAKHQLAGALQEAPKFEIPNRKKALRSSGSAFTLVEVLAALLFMGIVIPVAVEALQIANRAGQVAQRKTEAVRVGERILNENIITTNANAAGQSGTVFEGYRQFRWTLRDEPWSQGTTNQIVSSASMGQGANGQPQVNQFTANQIQMELLTVEVTYAVQGQDYSVRLSTLVNAQ